MYFCRENGKGTTSPRFGRSVVAKISRLLILLVLAGQREAQGSRVAAVQPQRLFQSLFLQAQRLRQVGAQLLRALALVALVVAVVAQGTAAVLLVELGQCLEIPKGFWLTIRKKINEFV